MAGTDAEVRAAFEGYVAYFGTFCTEGDDVVVHSIDASLFPNLEGTNQKRFIDLNDKYLTLASPPTTVGGKEYTARIMWQRDSTAR
jgi:hypothetical protein